MKPEQIKAVDPYYADEKKFANNEPRRALHDATIQLNDLLETQGQRIDLDESIAGYIRKFLTLDRDFEAFFETHVLPPHDSFTLEDSRNVPSDFLL